MKSNASIQNCLAIENGVARTAGGNHPQPGVAQRLAETERVAFPSKRDVRAQIPRNQSPPNVDESFREGDRQSMKRAFDLWSLDDVSGDVW